MHDRWNRAPPPCCRRSASEPDRDAAGRRIGFCHGCALIVRLEYPVSTMASVCRNTRRWRDSRTRQTEQRLGQTASKGCVRIPAAMNAFSIDWRAEGTFNAQHIRGLGVKGMRVWDFGWPHAENGWTDGTGDIRLLLHATDPTYLAERARERQDHPWRPRPEWRRHPASLRIVRPAHRACPRRHR